MKALNLLFVPVSVFALAAPVSAADVLLEDFDNPLTGLFFNHVLSSEFDAVNGVTQGLTSGKVTMPAEWKLAYQLRQQDYPDLYQTLRNSPDKILKVDFTMTTTPASWWFQTGFVIQGENLEFAAGGSPALFDSGTPTNGPITLSWDYSAKIASLPATQAWFEVFIYTNTGVGGHTVNYDNLRVSAADVPEPATLALLGLLSAGLLLRRQPLAD